MIWMSLLPIFSMDLIVIGQPSSIHLNLDVLPLSRIDLSTLEIDFIQEEIWGITKNLPLHKAPGPTSTKYDGM